MAGQATGNDHRLDSVAQNRPLGAPTMSLDQAGALLDKYTGEQADAESAKTEAAEKKKKQGVWGFGGAEQNQLNQLEKEGN